MNSKWLLVGTCACSSMVCAKESSPQPLPQTTSPQELPYAPWLTGSLIVLPGVVAPKGHFAIDTYFNFNVDTGVYDRHWHAHSIPNFYTFTPQIFAYIGLTQWMDFQIYPLVVYHATEGQSSTHFGDLPIGFDFQLFPIDASTWFPGIKLSLLEFLPTGKYQRLNPRKKGTDESGDGSYATDLNLILYKVYHIGGHHFFSTTYSLAYTIHSSVVVHGFNHYGGGFGTSGTVHPGKEFAGIFSFEYTLTQNWVFAMDNVYEHSNIDRFSGKPGMSASGVPATVGFLSSDRISVAPSMEYNFSNHFGIVAGVWFSIFGRNDTRFRSGIVEFAYFY